MKKKRRKARKGCGPVLATAPRDVGLGRFDTDTKVTASTKTVHDSGNKRGLEDEEEKG